MSEEKLIKVNDLIRAYKRVASTDAGKIVLDDLEKFCGYNATSFCEQTPNALQTAFHEGKRRVFLRINDKLKQEIEQCPR